MIKGRRSPPQLRWGDDDGRSIADVLADAHQGAEARTAADAATLAST